MTIGIVHVQMGYGNFPEKPNPEIEFEVCGVTIGIVHVQCTPLSTMAIFLTIQPGGRV